MSKADGVFIYIGTYASEVDARADYDVVKDLHAVGCRGHLRRRRDHQGRRRARSTSTRTRRRPATGPGAAPASAPWSASCSRRPSSARRLSAPPSAGVSGHLWKGMSRADVKEFGEAIDAGEAALVIVGETTIEAPLEKAELKAQKKVAKELAGRQEGRRQGGAGGGAGDVLT